VLSPYVPAKLRTKSKGKLLNSLKLTMEISRPHAPALVLAKVIIAGESLGIGERFAHQPLIFSTLYKTLFVAFCVLVLGILEHLGSLFL